jgi:hypothetical protein
MTDTTWIRTYNSKSVWTDTGLLGSNGGLTIGYGGASPPSGGAIISGNVGIGTTSASNKLVVGSDLTGASLVPANTIAIGAADTSSDAVLQIGESPTAKGFLKWFGTQDYFGIGTGSSIYPLVLKAEPGNVGIGTTSPQRAKLEIGDSVISPINSPWGSGANTHAFSIFAYDPTPPGTDKIFYNIEGTVKELGATGVSGYRLGVHGVLVSSDESTWYVAGTLAQQSGPYNRAAGVYGTVNTCPSGYTCYSGYFSGGSGVYVNGNFTATGTKSFEIDHPTKPGMKLVHACIEGPEVAVFYRGEGKLINGEAVVELPDYFEALTRREGRTVQLTPKGAEPYLLSATDVVDGKFKVYGSKPDGSFYWEVKAVRADVEPLKVEVERK